MFSEKQTLKERVKLLAKINETEAYVDIGPMWLDPILYLKIFIKIKRPIIY